MKNPLKSVSPFGRKHRLSALLLAATGALVTTGHAQSFTPVFTNTWNVATGSRYDLLTDNNARGIAVNPLTGNVLLASRTGGSNRPRLNPDSPNSTDKRQARESGAASRAGWGG